MAPDPVLFDKLAKDYYIKPEYLRSAGAIATQIRFYTEATLDQQGQVHPRPTLGTLAKNNEDNLGLKDLFQLFGLKIRRMTESAMRVNLYLLFNTMDIEKEKNDKIADFQRRMASSEARIAALEARLAVLEANNARVRSKFISFRNG